MWSGMAPVHDIGISTSAFSGLLLGPALEHIAALAPAAEIRSFGLHTLLSAASRSAALAAGLAYTVHGPFGDCDVGAPDETARLAALDEHRRHLEASAEIGARLYVVHPDWHPERCDHDPRVVVALDRSFAHLAELGDEVGVAIVVENMPGPGQSHFTHPGELDLHGLGLLLDVGHARISGTLHEWLSEPGAPLRHVHLHDNHGAGDEDDPHRALGAGDVDDQTLGAVFRAARAHGASLVLELYSHADVVASLAHLRRLGLLDVGAAGALPGDSPAGLPR
jgi:sugar phosphate isomerase/epimerase